MANHKGFDNEKYLKEQTAAIRERLERFDNKLYLEFGGKLLFDYHAARVLPGFDPNVKMRLLQQLKEQADVILCIYAGDIERRKLRADFGITYDVDALKQIDDLRSWGIDVSAVVITRFDGQPAATIFKNKLERRNVPVYTHGFIKGYPTDVDRIVSDDGYGSNCRIKTEKPLVIVTGPGPGSGKLATCLTQLYHDYKAGKKSGYAKFETFPIWNIPLKHPVNIAYEAATADLADVNLIDPFHLETYDERAVNYNRDVEIFPVLKSILEQITGEASPYNSPTDMGVNRVGFAIDNDELVQQAAKQEVISRYFRYNCEYLMGFVDDSTVERVKRLMKELKVEPTNRPVVEPARASAEQASQNGKGHKGIYCGAALKLANGKIVTGKNSPLMHATSSLVLNTLKELASIPDSLHLLSPQVIEAVTRLKETTLGMKTASLDLDEALIALSISAGTNPTAEMVMGKLKDLQGCEVHLTHIPSPGDEVGLRRLGLKLTNDARFAGRDLFQE